MWMEEGEAGYGGAGDGRFVDRAKVQDFELGIRVRRNRRDSEQFLAVKTLYIRQHVYSASGTYMHGCIAWLAGFKFQSLPNGKMLFTEHSKCY
jgi:hypothetical protein